MAKSPIGYLHAKSKVKYDSNYPSLLKKYLADNAPATITALGNIDILTFKTLAIFSSINKMPREHYLENL